MIRIIVISAKHKKSLNDFVEALEEKYPDISERAIYYRKEYRRPLLFGSGEKIIEKVRLKIEINLEELDDEQKLMFAKYGLPGFEVLTELYKGIMTVEAE